ncbi:MAG: hypothetical protein NC548_47955, partial [Lachnospiraceae bacterium]|nr:hypothetical protein [Lachnospiraceae bacterium]
MKKFLSSILAIVMLLSTLTTVNISAFAVTEHNVSDVKSVQFSAARDLYANFDYLSFGIQADVTFKDGDTFVYDFGYNYEYIGDGNDYLYNTRNNLTDWFGNCFEFETDGDLNSVGTVNVTVVDYLSDKIPYNENFTINVVENPIDSIEYLGSDIDIGSNRVEQRTDEYYDPDKEEWISNTYNAYEYYECSYDDIKINYKNGNSTTVSELGIGSGWAFDGYSSSVFIKNAPKAGFEVHANSRHQLEFVSNQCQSPWSESNSYPVTIKYMGKECTYNVNIFDTDTFKNSVVSIEYVPVKPLSVIENCNGYTNNNDNYIYFTETIFNSGDKLLFNMRDGSIIIGEHTRNGDAEIYGYFTIEGETLYEGIEFDLTFSDNQDESPWTKNGNNFITMTYNGLSCQIPVTVIENPIADISYTPVKEISFPIYTNGFWDSDQYLEEDFVYYNLYNYNFFSNGDSITVTEKNGNSTNYIYSLIDDENYDFLSDDGKILDYSIDLYDRVKIGTNYFTIGVQGKTIDVPFELTPNGESVESISFVTDREIVLENGYETNGYYFYNYESTQMFSDGDKLNVTYKNGKTVSFTYEYNPDDIYEFGAFYADNGSVIDNRPENILLCDNQGANPFTSDGENYLSLVYMGAMTQVPIIVKPISESPDIDIDSLEQISAGETKTANIDAEGVYAYFKFIPDEDGTYTFYSDSSEDTYGYLYDSNMNELAADDDSGKENNFSISYDFYAGETYIIGARYYDSSKLGSFDVNLKFDSSVNSIKYIRANQQPITEGIDYYFSDDYYDTPWISAEVGDQLIINYSDGTYKDFVYHEDWNDTDEDYDCKFISEDGEEIDYSNVEFDSYRDENSKLFVSVKCFNKKDTIFIEERKAVSIKYNPLSTPVIDETNIKMSNYNWFKTDENGNKYMYYSTQVNWYNTGDDVEILSNIIHQGDSFTVTYNDGDIVTYTYNNKSYEYGYRFDGDNGTEFHLCGTHGIQIQDNQLTDHWTVGENNYFTININGISSNQIPVEIAENPIESIEYIPNEEYVLYEKESNDYYVSIPAGKLIINYKDGSKKVYETEREGYIPSLDLYISCFYEDIQNWHLGTDNILTIYIFGEMADLPVNIVENPVESISVSCNKRYIADVSDAKTTGVPFNLTINYKNGNSETVVLFDGDEYENEHFDITDKRETYYPDDNRSEVQLTFEYCGKSFVLTIPNENITIDSIETRQVKIPALDGKLVDPLSIVDEGTVEFTVTLSNGDKEVFTSDKLQSYYGGGSLYDEDDTVHPFMWDYIYVGKYVFHIVYDTTFKGDYHFVDGTDVTFTIGDVSSVLNISTKTQEHIHNYVSVVTAPTCTEEGYTTYTCSCGESYVDNYVNASGHNWDEYVSNNDATYETDGTKTAVCSRCGEKDTIVDEGTKLVKEPDLSNFIIKTVSLSLESSVTMNFKVLKSAVADFENPYMVFKCDGLDDMTVSEYSVQGDYYVFSFPGISPQMMGNDVTATLYAVYKENGKEYSGQSKSMSVKEYSYKMLAAYGSYNNATYNKLKTLLVDLLNYGAQAQIYTNYKTNSLVNAELTEQQKAWGTSSTPTLTNITDKEYKTVSDPTAVWNTAGLVLNNSVMVRGKFTVDNIENVTVKITCNGRTFTYDKNDFTKNSDGSYYV